MSTQTIKELREKLATTEAALAESRGEVERALELLQTIPFKARTVARATGAVWAVDEVNEWEAAVAAFSQGKQRALKDSGVRYCVVHEGVMEQDEDVCDFSRDPIDDEQVECATTALLYLALEAPHEST